MGKRGNKRENEGNRTPGFHTSLSLREEASGKKQTHNSKSLLKLNHLQNLAQLSSSSSSIGCLGAFYGRRFAEFGESLGIPPDPSLFPCQRCETILQPGFNCTVRIEKNRAKCRRRSKAKTPTQNNVVYTCSFCTFRNLKRGTSKGYMKELTSSKAASVKPKSERSAAPKRVTLERIDANNVRTDKLVDKKNCDVQTDKAVEKSNFCDVKMDKAIEAPSVVMNKVTSLTEGSLAASGAKLLDSKRRTRKKPGTKETSGETMVSSAQAEREKCSGTSKKKKAWTSLKDIAEKEKLEKNQRFKKFSIPFVL